MNNELRNKYLDNLKSIVNDDHDIAEQIEKGIYRYTKENSVNKTVFKKVYRDKYLMIVMNLQNKKNPSLLNDVISGKINPEELAFKTHQELFPDIWIGRYEKQQQLNLKRMAKQIDFTESIYVCRKCKANKNVYYQMQTRSADEPMTTFVTCICGNRWKC